MQVVSRRRDAQRLEDRARKEDLLRLGPLTLRQAHVITCCLYFTGFLLSQNGWLRTVTDLTTYLTTISSFKNCVGFGGLRLEAYMAYELVLGCKDVPRTTQHFRAADCATTAQTLLVSTTRTFSSAHAALEGS